MTHLTRQIRNLTTGAVIASAGFTDNRNGDVWAWLSETVASEVGCRVEDVSVVESEDGDMLAVSGVPVYFLN